jgi:L-ribulose-5-phosphate 3-epimerase
MERREFLKLAGAGVAGSTLLSGLTPVSALAWETGAMRMPGIHLFSKCLQFLDYQELAATAATLGLSGFDLTVRPRGHVEPENFERDLPAAIKAMNEAGVSCEMMVTKIVSTENQRDYDLLALAHSLGIKSYRLGGLRFDPDVSQMESVERYKLQLASLAEWNREIGITGMYQNHSGEGHFGASIWDIYLATKDLDPDALGIQFDIRHATTEGGRKWPDSFRLIQPQIRSLAFKDFKWAEIDGKWRLVSTPIGEGMIDFNRYFRMLKDAGMNYPISLHCEYDLGGAEKGKKDPTMPKEEILAAIKRDVDTVKRIWAEA